MIYLWFVVMIITYDFIKYLIRKLGRRITKDLKEMCEAELEKRRQQALNKESSPSNVEGQYDSP